jgi:hypothetical protein
MKIGIKNDDYFTKVRQIYLGEREKNKNYQLIYN